jgi:hypothetical protein
MTPEVTKIVFNKMILNVWIENGPVLYYGPGIELAFRSNSYVELSIGQLTHFLDFLYFIS